MNPEEIMFSHDRIPEPSAEMRAMATEMRQLAAALTESGFTVPEVEHAVDQQTMYALLFIRRGTYMGKDYR